MPVVARSQPSTDRARAGGATDIVASLAKVGAIDGVVIATPEPDHAAHVREAMTLDVPIFCEKPLTIDPKSAALIASEAAGRVFVMDKWRYHPGVEALRDIAKSGELGPVVGLRCVRVGWGTAHPTSDSIWHLLTHDLSIAIEVLGEVPDPRDAVAQVIDGRVHGLHGLLGESPWMSVEASSAHSERRREIVLMLEGGIAWLDSPEATGIKVARAIGEEPEVRPIGAGLPLLAELRAFVEHLEGGPAPRSSAKEGAAIVATVGRLRELAGLQPASPEN